MSLTHLYIQSSDAFFMLLSSLSSHFFSFRYLCLLAYKKLSIVWTEFFFGCEKLNNNKINNFFQYLRASYTAPKKISADSIQVKLLYNTRQIQQKKHFFRLRTKNVFSFFLRVQFIKSFCRTQSVVVRVA
jgi:hypothetical protein